MKLKPEKYWSLNVIRTHDLCDTGVVLYQLSHQANWEHVTLWVLMIIYLLRIQLNIWKITFLNCRERYEGMNDHHIFYTQLIKQLWSWGVKKPKTLSHCESVTYMQKVRNANEYIKDHIFEPQRKILAWFIIQHSYTHNLTDHILLADEPQVCKKYHLIYDMFCI